MDWRKNPKEAKERIEKMINLLTCLHETREDLVNENISFLREKTKIITTFLDGASKYNKEELKKITEEEDRDGKHE